MIGVIMAGGEGLVAIAAIHAMQEKKKNKKQSKVVGWGLLGLL